MVKYNFIKQLKAAEEDINKIAATTINKTSLGCLALMKQLKVLQIII